MFKKIVGRAVLAVSGVGGTVGAVTVTYGTYRAFEDEILKTGSRVTYCAELAKATIYGFATGATLWPLAFASNPNVDSHRLNDIAHDYLDQDSVADTVYGALLPVILAGRGGDVVKHPPSAMVTRRFEGDRRLQIKYDPTSKDILNALRNRGEDEVALHCGTSAVIDLDKLETGVSLSHVSK